MEYRRNQESVDTSHPSVNVTFSTSQEKDVTLQNGDKKSDVYYALNNHVQGTDELKVAYLTVAKAIIPASWWNIHEDSYMFVSVHANADDALVGLYLVKPQGSIFGGHSRTSWCTRIAGEGAGTFMDEFTYKLLQGAYIGAGPAVRENLPFPVSLIDAYAGGDGGKLRLDKRIIANVVDADHYVRVYSSKNDIYTLPYRTDRINRMIDYIGFIGNANAFGDVRQAGAVDEVAQFNPVTSIRLHTSIPLNTPVISQMFENAMEVIPTCVNMGQFVVYEATTPFQMMVPQMNLMDIRCRLLDQDGREVNMRDKDWVISFHIHFLNRSLGPPSVVNRPMDDQAHPLQKIDAKRARFNYGDQAWDGGEPSEVNVTSSSSLRASRAPNNFT